MGLPPPEEPSQVRGCRPPRHPQQGTSGVVEAPRGCNLRQPRRSRVQKFGGHAPPRSAKTTARSKPNR
eukprot:5417337-Alexandrium_andersonii.AAC.1